MYVKFISLTATTVQNDGNHGISDFPGVVLSNMHAAVNFTYKPSYIYIEYNSLQVQMLKKLLIFTKTPKLFSRPFISFESRSSNF